MPKLRSMARLMRVCLPDNRPLFRLLKGISQTLAARLMRGSASNSTALETTCGILCHTRNENYLPKKNSSLICKNIASAPLRCTVRCKDVQFWNFNNHVLRQKNRIADEKRVYCIFFYTRGNNSRAKKVTNSHVSVNMIKWITKEYFYVTEKDTSKEMFFN